jgi:uncharacterized protein (TIGR02996 family)
MTDETAFQAALDAEPSNSGMRLVFADWLEEHGDWRAAGYRWMGEHHKWPYDWSKSPIIEAFQTHDWFIENVAATWEVPSHCVLPVDFGPWFPSPVNWPSYNSRRAAEEALCRVIHERLAAADADNADKTVHLA